MTITDRTLREGEFFVARYKKQDYKVQYAPSEASDDAKKNPFVGVEPNSIKGLRYLSLGDAGKKIMGGVSCNGWRFFERPADREAKATAKAEAKAETSAEPKAKTKKPAAAAKPKTFTQVKRTRKQPEDESLGVSWHCSACQEGFYLPKGETPSTCPNGHPRIVNADADDGETPAAADPEEAGEAGETDSAEVVADLD